MEQNRLPLVEISSHANCGLQKALKRLETANGLINFDLLWEEGFPASKRCGLLPVNDAVILSEARITLTSLKELHTALSILSDSLATKISAVKALMEPLVLFHGINSLPDEVLALVCEAACNGVDDGQPVLNLWCVNKRFRNVLERLPRLWCKVSNVTPDDRLLFLKNLNRSKSVGLNIELDIDDTEILDVIVPHAHRWERILFNMECLPGGSCSKRFTQMTAHCANLPRLSSLKRAELQYPGEAMLQEQHEGENNGDILDQSDDLLHFYAAWDAPHLQELVFYNLIPRQFDLPTPSLTTFTLTLYAEGGERAIDLGCVLAFLRSTPSIEDITLEFINFALCEDEDDSIIDTELPNVRTLNLMAIWFSPQDLAPFLFALRLPNLVTLSVNVGVDEEAKWVADAWLDCIFPQTREPYKHIENFTFSTKLCIDRDAQKAYRIPFARLPSLRSLTISTPFLCPDVSGDETLPFPRLQRLRFDGCNKLSHKSLQTLKHRLKCQNKWEDLEEVSFTGCHDICEAAVREFFHGKRVTWETRWGRSGFIDRDS